MQAALIFSPSMRSATMSAESKPSSRAAVPSGSYGFDADLPDKTPPSAQAEERQDSQDYDDHADDGQNVVHAAPPIFGRERYR